MKAPWTARSTAAHVTLGKNKISPEIFVHNKTDEMAEKSQS